MKNISTLIAEDDFQNATIINRFVDRLEGFEVCGIATSFLQAKDMTEVMKPELILLDNHFPDGNGTDLLQFARNNNFQTEVIMITASKDANTIRDALHGGIFDYIIKPINYQRLDSSLNKYKDYHFKLHSSESLRQDDVDILLKRHQLQQPTNETRLPKGIDALTLEKVRKQISHTNDAYTAENLGSIIGMSRTTARRYLEYLVGVGEIFADVNYGTIGRPERVYKNKK